MTQHTFAWPAKFEDDPESGNVVVSFRDLPECLTEGDDLSDARAEAEDALAEAISSRLAHGEEIPMSQNCEDGEIPIFLPPLFAAKLGLHIALAGTGISQRELARRMGCDEREIRRLLDPKHGSKIERIAEALTHLSGRLTVTVETA